MLHLHVLAVCNFMKRMDAVIIFSIVLKIKGYLTLNVPMLLFTKHGLI